MSNCRSFASVSSVRFAAVVGALALTSGAAQASPSVPDASPKAMVQQQVGVTTFTLEYSSPGVKGRKIWGGLVPYDALWRTGANAATKLTATRDFKVGGKTVPAGSYALYTIPGKSSWTVVLNTNANASGTSGYDKKNDVATFTVKPTILGSSRERLTFVFTDTTDDRTRLDLEWEKLRVSIPIEVDTKAHVLADIDDSLKAAWRPHFVSARYLLENNGDLDKALSYAETSIAIQPTWWNNWVRAQVLAKKGRAADAVQAGDKTQELGKGDYVFENFYKERVQKAVADWKKAK